MKGIFNLLFVFILLTLLFGCEEEKKSFFEKKDFSGKISEVILVPSKTEISPDNIDEVTFNYKVINQFDEVVLKKNIEIFVGGKKINSTIFKTDDSGEYEAYAIVEGIKSETVIIKAKDVITDVKLNNLNVIGFKKSNYGYELNNLNNSIKYIKLEVYSTDNKYFCRYLTSENKFTGWHQYTIEAEIPVKEGRNEIEIIKDTSDVRPYKFGLYKKSNDASLSKIEILNVEDFIFDSENLDYDNLKLEDGKGYIRIIPTASDEKSKIEILYNEKIIKAYSGQKSSQIAIDKNELEIVIKVTPEDENQAAYEYNLVIFKEEINEINNLEILVDNKSILNNFNSTKTEYTDIIVKNEVENIEIKADYDSKYKVIGLGDQSLKVGNNKFSVEVSFDNKKTDYEVNIYRESNETGIEKININDQEYYFNEEEKEITLSDEIEEISLELFPKFEKITDAKVFMDNKEIVLEGLKKEIFIGSSENELTIEIIAEDNNYESEYKLLIKRANTKSDLKNIKINNKSINVEGIYVYPLETVSNSIKSINLEIEKKDRNQSVTLKLNEESIINLELEEVEKINLLEGNNTLTIKVELEGEVNTYTLNIRRKKINIDLKYIEFNGEEFYSDSNEVDLGKVNSSLTEIKIKAILDSNNNSSIEYNNDSLEENSELKLSLDEGENRFKIRVLAEEEGYEEEYIIKVYKANGETGLSELKINNKDYNFQEEVNNVVEILVGDLILGDLEINLDLKKKNSLSKVYLDNKELENSNKIELNSYGENIIKLKVVSEDEEDEIMYKINLNAKENKPLGTIENLKVEFKDGDYTIICSNVINAISYEFFISDSYYGTYSSLGKSDSGTEGIIIQNWDYGKKYYFKAKVENNIEDLESDIIDYTTAEKITAPTRLEETEIGDTYIEIKWDSSNNDAKFRVYVDGIEKEDNISNTTYRVTGLTANKNYDIKVEAYNKILKVESIEIEIKTKYSTSGLSKASNLNIKDISNMNCQITVDPVDGASEYEFYINESYSTNIDDYDSIGKTNNLKIGIQKQLSYDRKYYFYVVVRNSEIEVQSNLIEYIIPKKVTVPQNVREVSKTENSITIEWDSVDGADGYNIRENNKYGNATNVSNNSTYTFTGLSEGEKVTVVVEAYNNFSQEFTEKKDFFTVKSIKSPENLQLIESIGNSIKISWNSVDGAKGYKVYQNGDRKKTLTSSELTFELNYLTPAENYDIEVEAFNDTMTSEKTYAIFNSGLKTPENIIILSESFTSVKISCSRIDGATEYEVYDANGYGTTYLFSDYNLDDGILIEGLKPNSRKSFFIVAKTGGVRSNNSEIIIIDTPEILPPVNLSILRLPSSEVVYQLNWDGVEGAEKYKVRLFRSDIQEEIFIEQTQPSDENVIIKIGNGNGLVEGNRTYKIKVATCIGEYEVWSDELEVTLYR